MFSLKLKNVTSGDIRRSSLRLITSLINSISLLLSYTLMNSACHNGGLDPRILLSLLVLYILLEVGMKFFKYSYLHFLWINIINALFQIFGTFPYLCIYVLDLELNVEPNFWSRKFAEINIEYSPFKIISLWTLEKITIVQK